MAAARHRCSSWPRGYSAQFSPTWYAVAVAIKFTRRKLLLLIALVLLVLPASVIAVLNYGRGITRFVDRFVTTHERSLPTTQFTAVEGNPGTYYGGRIAVDDQEMFNAGLDFFAYPMTLKSDSTGQLVLSTGGKSFVLGPLLSTTPGPGDNPRLHFAPGSGDKVRFDIEHSILGWPTPFRVNYMTGGPMPSRARAVYYRLRWQKPDGASLEMLWTYDQDYYSADGWRPVYTGGGVGGLAHVTIRP